MDRIESETMKVRVPPPLRRKIDRIQAAAAARAGIPVKLADVLRDLLARGVEAVDRERGEAA